MTADLREGLEAVVGLAERARRRASVVACARDYDTRLHLESEALQAEIEASAAAFALIRQHGPALLAQARDAEALRAERDGAIAAYENLRGAGAVCCKSMRDQLEAAQRQASGKQARIDELMLEYCPDEMTGEQLQEWGKHQVVASDPADTARLDWLEARAFTVYRNRDPCDGNLIDHVTVVNEDASGSRRGILGPTLRAAIDAALSQPGAGAG